MKFLSETEQSILDNLFSYRTVKKWKRDGPIITQKGKKSVIPIGVHDLKIKNIGWTESKKGEKMLHFQIWKAPWKDTEVLGWSESGRSERMVSFDFINCYHLIAESKQYSLKDRWFLPVGRYYTEEQLSTLFKMKNKVFKCLVKHVEQEFNTHYFTKAEIRYVFQKGEEVDENNIDYFKLYERLER